MKPDNQPVLQSEEWRALLRASPPHYRELARKLDSEDISSLIERLETPEIQEQIAAIRLMHAARLENVPVAEPQKQQLIAKLAPIMRSYPNQPGLYAFILMCLLEQPVAERFLLEDVDVSRIPGSYFRYYLADLKRVNSNRAMDRIVGYAKLRGEMGETAARFLKTHGIVEPAEIEELAARWRESRSLKYLNDLYTFYISHQSGKPMHHVLELLGSWNDHSFNSYRYDSAEGPSLFIFSDEHGNLDAFKLK